MRAITQLEYSSKETNATKQTNATNVVIQTTKTIKTTNHSTVTPF